MKNYSLKTKLLLLVSLCLILLGSIIITVSVIKSTVSLEEETMNKLAAVESSKSEEIKNYFKDLEALLVSLANSKSTKDAFTDFEDGFYKLSDELEINVSDVKALLKRDFEV